MNQLHTVEAFVIDAIKAERLPGEIIGCPLSVEARSLLMAECPVVLVDPQAKESLPFTSARTVQGYDADQIALHQPSTGHVRSFALRGEGLRTPWQDEYGNIFRDFNLKGNNFSSPGVMPHPTATDEYVAWGLQESKIIERVLRASAVMRSRGIGTEYIIGLAEPKAYPYPTVDATTESYEQVSLPEYRDRITENYWRTLPEEEQTIEKLGELNAKFREMTFYISLRAVDTVYRLGDVVRDDQAREEVFAFINEHQLYAGEKPLDPAVVSDRHRYEVEFLAPKLGKNLARLHKDMAHGFLHRLNVTGLGSIVDNDSIHGEPLGLGDKPITAEDRAGDILTVATELFRLSPVAFAPSHQLEPVWQFFAHYIEGTKAMLGSTEATRQQIAESLLAAEQLIIDNPRQFNRVSHEAERLLEGLQNIFVDRLILQHGKAAYVTELQNAIASELMHHASLEETAEVVRKHLRENSPHYAALMIGTFINELDDDPDFDVIQPLLSGNYKHLEAHDEMITNVQELIFAAYTKSNSDLPELTGIDPASQMILFNVAQQMVHDHLRGYAENLVDELLPELESSLRDGCVYSCPEPLLGEEQNSYRRMGFVQQRYWLSTERVPFEDVRALLSANEEQIFVETIDPSRPLNQTNLKIASGHMVDEIITDGIFGSSTVSDDTSTLDIEADDDDTTEPSYVLVIQRNEDSSRMFTFYVTEEDFDDVQTALGLDGRTPDKQPTLF